MKHTFNYLKQLTYIQKLLSSPTLFIVLSILMFSKANEMQRVKILQTSHNMVLSPIDLIIQLLMPVNPL